MSMMLVAARAEAPQAHEPMDSLCTDQAWIDEEFFRIVQGSFPARTVTCSAALPALAGIVQPDPPPRGLRWADDRSVLRTRVRSPPTQGR